MFHHKNHAEIAKNLIDTIATLRDGLAHVRNVQVNFIQFAPTRRIKLTDADLKERQKVIGYHQDIEALLLEAQQGIQAVTDGAIPNAEQRRAIHALEGSVSYTSRIVEQEFSTTDDWELLGVRDDVARAGRSAKRALKGDYMQQLVIYAGDAKQAEQPFVPVEIGLAQRVEQVKERLGAGPREMDVIGAHERLHTFYLQMTDLQEAMSKCLLAHVAHAVNTPVEDPAKDYRQQCAGAAKKLYGAIEDVSMGILQLRHGEAPQEKQRAALHEMDKIIDACHQQVSECLQFNIVEDAEWRQAMQTAMDAEPATTRMVNGWFGRQIMDYAGDKAKSGEMFAAVEPTVLQRLGDAGRSAVAAGKQVVAR